MCEGARCDSGGIKACVVRATTNKSKVLKKKTVGEKFHTEMKGYVNWYAWTYVGGAECCLRRKMMNTGSVACRDRGLTIVFSAAGGNVFLHLRGQDGVRTRTQVRIIMRQSFYRKLGISANQRQNEAKADLWRSVGEKVEVGVLELCEYGRREMDAYVRRCEYRIRIL